MNSLLTAEERDELRSQVIDRIWSDPTLVTTLIPRHHAVRIPTNAIPDEYAGSVIRYCETSAWVEDPALIITLLEKFKHFQIFQEAIDRIRNGKPLRFHTPPRIWDAILLALDLPFMNREKTREAVEHFSSPLESSTKLPGIRTLVVKGPRFSGKTFTYDYIRYINCFLGVNNVRTVLVDFKKQATSRFGPLDLTQAILDQINSDWSLTIQLPVLNNQGVARWIIQLCCIIVEQITKLDRICMLVLDSLDDNRTPDLLEGAQRIPTDTFDMIQKLAAIATGADLASDSSDLLRVVLLGFERPIVNYKNRVRVDDIKLLTRSDIKSYFINYARFYGKTIDDQGLNDMVTAVMDDDDIDDPHRTEKLARQALIIAKAIVNT